jgi:uncharacterized membrane protein YphA (DoxX/SURF4 family)
LGTRREADLHTDTGGLMGARKRFAAVQPWVSLLVRVAAGVIMAWAGIAKLLDVHASVRAVRAYRLLPEAVVPLVGNVLPYIEISLGILLIAGIMTRTMAIVYLALLVVYVSGTIWAWAHGLRIDCGCFGGDGTLAAGATTNYAAHFVERAEFIALGVWLLVFPQSRLSLDRWLRPVD